MFSSTRTRDPRLCLSMPLSSGSSAGSKTAAFKTFVRELVPKNANVVLEVKESNPSGQRFWESLSFRPIGVAYELDRQDGT